MFAVLKKKFNELVLLSKFCIYLDVCGDVVAAAVGHSRGRGLLKFSSGSPSPTSLQTRPPGQVQWVSEQWSPSIAVSLPSSANPPPGMPLGNNEPSCQGTPVSLLSSLIPSHSTPALSLHSTNAPGQRFFGTPATADLSPSATSPRSAGKRPEPHSATANGDIPLMTSASDPLPVPAHIAHVDPVFRTPSPSLCMSKTSRVSPHHVTIHPAQQNSPVPSPSPRTPPRSPVRTMMPVSLASWQSPATSVVRSPHFATAASQSASVQSALSPLAPLFVPRHCSADNLVSVRF